MDQEFPAPGLRQENGTRFGPHPRMASLENLQEQSGEIRFAAHLAGHAEQPGVILSGRIRGG
jgi:hypothetical protein